MKRGDARGQGIDVCRGQRAVLQQAACQRALRKLAHFHRVLDDGATAFDGWIIGAAGDRHHRLVHGGRKPAIQTQLLVAVMVARLQRGEIEKPQVNRLLDFVGMLPGQYHPRDMGFQHVDTLHRMRVARRIAQCCDERRRFCG